MKSYVQRDPRGLDAPSVGSGLPESSSVLESRPRRPGRLPAILRSCAVLVMAWGWTAAQAQPLSFVTAGAFGSVVSFPTGGGTDGISLTAGSGNGLNGVDLTGSGYAYDPGSNPQTDGLTFYETVFTNRRDFGGRLPLSWDFTVSSDKSYDQIGWELYFGFSNGVNGTENIYDGGVAPGGTSTRIRGTDGTAYWTSGTYPIYDCYMWLEVTQFQQGDLLGQNPELAINVNINSIEINATPEPTPVFTLAVGLGACLVRRRGTRKRRY